VDASVVAVLLAVNVSVLVLVVLLD